MKQFWNVLDTSKKILQVKSIIKILFSVFSAQKCNFENLTHISKWLLEIERLQFQNEQNLTKYSMPLYRLNIM